MQEHKQYMNRGMRFATLEDVFEEYKIWQEEYVVYGLEIVWILGWDASVCATLTQC